MYCAVYIFLLISFARCFSLPLNVDDKPEYSSRFTAPLLQVGQKYYYLGIYFVTDWYKAAHFCRYHGMDLASISSQKENDEIQELIKSYNAETKGFWLSGNDFSEEGSFYWFANGKPVTFTSWRTNEPNNAKHENGERENCIEAAIRDNKLIWNDTKCSFQRYFICEIQ